MSWVSYNKLNEFGKAIRNKFISNEIVVADADKTKGVHLNIGGQDGLLAMSPLNEDGVTPAALWVTDSEANNATELTGGTLSYVTDNGKDTEDYTSLSLVGGVVNVSGKNGAQRRITNVATPTGENDAATKKYVDSIKMEQDEINNQLYQISDELYEGVDLTVKFADEIANYSDEWAWLEARRAAGNFKGIHVADYITVTLNGNIYHAEIMGINTYKNYGDTAVGDHIDFILRELWETLHVWNKVNYNNGISSIQYPFLASDLYYYMNALSGSVPNATTVNPATTSVNYTSSGIYYYFPTKLKNVLKNKLVRPAIRYSSSSLLTDDNSWNWVSMGKLWIPSEMEVYGTDIWSDKKYSVGGFQQYPYFKNNMRRVKNIMNGSRSPWWLLSSFSGYSTATCLVTADGFASYTNTSSPNIAVAVCFRV